LIPLWRLLLGRRRLGQLPSEELLSAVQIAITYAVSRNLMLTDQIEHWFVTGSSEVLAKEHAPRLKQLLRETLAHIYGGDPRNLAARLDNCPPYLLWRLVWGLDRVREMNFEGDPFQGWHEFANTIAESGTLAPDIMLPQIATLVVRSGDRSDGTRLHEYDRALAERLFGHGRIMALFSTNESSRGTGSGPYEAVKQHASSATA
jgi:hypothetical protein